MIVYGFELELELKLGLRSGPALSFWAFYLRIALWTRYKHVSGLLARNYQNREREARRMIDRPGR